MDGYCYPPYRNMAKLQLSLVVVHLQLNPRRVRCIHLAAALTAQFCSKVHLLGPFCSFLSSCIQGLTLGLIMG